MSRPCRRSWPKCPDITIRGRVFQQSDVVLIRQVIRDHPKWGRTRISQRVCEKLGWIQQNGLLKERACRIALVRLDDLGLIELPPPQIRNCGGKPPAAHSLCGFTITATSIKQMPQAIEIRKVETSSESRLWNTLIANYHYLGLGTSVGKLIRYLFYSEERILGAISYTNSTWSNEPRSRALKAVGLDPSPAPDFVISNNRFVILPHIRVKNLASKMLSLSIRQIQHDWRLRYGCTPLVAETFVDTARFVGTSYLAANWIPIGLTKGFSKRGGSHYRNDQRKLILLRGICPRYHNLLAKACERKNGRASEK